MDSSVKAWLLFAVTIVFLAGSVRSAATIFTVGDSTGWTIRNSPNYTLWASGKTFRVGDKLLAINALYMQFYIGGVSCPYICSRYQDHGVVVVGYGSAGFAPIRFKNKPYWIIKNSWGENWGDNGYYKICKGHNICGVESEVSTVTVTNTAHRP